MGSSSHRTSSLHHTANQPHQRRIDARAFDAERHEHAAAHGCDVQLGRGRSVVQCGNERRHIRRELFGEGERALAVFEVRRNGDGVTTPTFDTRGRARRVAQRLRSVGAAIGDALHERLHVESIDGVAVAFQEQQRTTSSKDAVSAGSNRRDAQKLVFGRPCKRICVAGPRVARGQRGRTTAAVGVRDASARAGVNIMRASVVN